MRGGALGKTTINNHVARRGGPNGRWPAHNHKLGAPFMRAFAHEWDSSIPRSQAWVVKPPSKYNFVILSDHRESKDLRLIFLEGQA